MIATPNSMQGNDYPTIKTTVSINEKISTLDSAVNLAMVLIKEDLNFEGGPSPHPQHFLVEFRQLEN